MVNPTIKTIVFDFDGVITNSFELIFEIWQSNYPDLTREEYLGIMNLAANDPLRLSFNNRKGTGVINDFDFQTEYSVKLKGTKLEEVKRKVLEELSNEYTLHIVSSVNTQPIKDFLEHNNVLDCFKEVLGRDVEVSKKKKFQMLFEKYNLEPREAIFVTDTVGDINEAKAFGIENIIAVTDGFHSRESLEKAAPKFVIDSITNLRGIL